MEDGVAYFDEKGLQEKSKPTHDNIFLFSCYFSLFFCFLFIYLFNQRYYHCEVPKHLSSSTLPWTTYVTKISHFILSQSPRHCSSCFAGISRIVQLRLVLSKTFWQLQGNPINCILHKTKRKFCTILPTMIIIRIFPTNMHKV